MNSLMQWMVSLAAFLAFSWRPLEGAIITKYPAMRGSTLSLECVKTSSSRILIWSKIDGQTIAIDGVLQPNFDGSKFSVSDTNSSSAGLKERLHIENVGVADEGNYTCQEFQQPGTASLHIFDVFILINPTLFDVSGPSTPVHEGSTARITCVSDGGRPLPIVTWHMTDVNGTRAALPVASNKVTQNSDGSMRRDVTTSFVITRSMLSAKFVCTVNIAPLSYTKSKEVDVNMNFRPLPPIITGAHEDLEEGNTATVTCQTSGAKPAARVMWYLNGHIYSGVETSVPQPDGTFTTQSRLTLDVTKETHGDLLECKVTNDVLTSLNVLPLSTSQTLSIDYSPVVEVNNATITMYDGRNVTLECKVSARPLPDSVTWLHNGASIAVNHPRHSIADDKMNPNLHLINAKWSDKGLYQCQATNRLGTRSSQSIYVNILHRPFCHRDHKTKYGVALGSTIILPCHMEANPNDVTFEWTSNGTWWSEEKIGDPGDMFHVYSTMAYTPRNESDYVTFRCRGKNSVGQSTQECPIQVVAPGPAEAPSSCLMVNHSETSIMIRCQAGFDGGSIAHYTLQEKIGVQLYRIHINSTEAFFTINELTPNIIYSFRVCVANSDFYEQIVCTDDFDGNTINDSSSLPSVSPVPLSSQEHIPYVIGGAVILFVIIVVIVIIVLAVICKEQKQKTEYKPNEHSPERRNSDMEKAFDNRAMDEEDLELYAKAVVGELDRAIEAGDVSIDINRRPSRGKTDKDPGLDTLDDGYGTIGTSPGHSRNNRSENISQNEHTSVNDWNRHDIHSNSLKRASSHQVLSHDYGGDTRAKMAANSDSAVWVTSGSASGNRNSRYSSDSGSFRSFTETDSMKRQYRKQGVYENEKMKSMRNDNTQESPIRHADIVTSHEEPSIVGDLKQIESVSARIVEEEKNLNPPTKVTDFKPTILSRMTSSMWAGVTGAVSYVTGILRTRSSSVKEKEKF